ncbi:hypothetical protein MKEN_00849600 [Mycena kentingensis (nom. inval.)]|nr:hypothetical protein MKEN_00849600 [Mycena kentingensis (nom. inval.)]
MWSDRSFKHDRWPESFRHDLAVQLHSMQKLCADVSAFQIQTIIGRTTRLPELREIAGAFEPEDLVELLKRAPQLQTLRLRPLSPNVIPLIESSTLSTLDLGWSSLALSEFQAVLKDCPLLADFRAGSIIGPPVAVEPAILLQMTSLRLCGWGGDALFLNAITLPRLHTLLLRLPREDAATNKTALATFLNRSRCHLARFGLYGCFESAAIYDCIRLCPTVEVLEMHDTVFSGEFPCESEVERFRQATFPQLRSLHIDVQVDNAWNHFARLVYKDLCTLVVALRSNGAPLEKLVISIEDSADRVGSGKCWFPPPFYARVLRRLLSDVTVKVKIHDDEYFEAEPQTIWWPPEAGVGDEQLEFELKDDPSF